MYLVTPDFGIIFWQTITFITVLIILRKFAWQPILETIRRREREIAQSIASAQEAKEEVRALQAKSEGLLSQASLEGERIIKEAILTKSRIVAEATVEAERVSSIVVQKAQQEIEKEKKQALQELKTHIASLTVYTTAQLLKRELKGQEAQEKMILEALETLESKR